MNQQVFDIQNLAQQQGIIGASAASSSNQLGVLLSSILQALMVIGLALVFFYFVWGAFDWITSAGEKGKLESARSKMMHAGIGIIILSSTVALFMLVQYFLGLDVITFGSSSSYTPPTCIPSNTNTCPNGPQ